MHPDVEGYGEVHVGEVYHESAFFDPKVAFANAGSIELTTEAQEAAKDSEATVTVAPVPSVAPTRAVTAVVVTSAPSQEPLVEEAKSEEYETQETALDANAEETKAADSDNADSDNKVVFE